MMYLQLKSNNGCNRVSLSIEAMMECNQMLFHTKETVSDNLSQRPTDHQTANEPMISNLKETM